MNMRISIRWLLPALLALALATGVALADGGILMGGYQDVINDRVTPQAYQPPEPRLHDPAGFPAPQEQAPQAPQASQAPQAPQSPQAPQEVSAPEAAPEAPSGEWTCPRCGSANDGNFCPNCGLARQWLCPGCGRENPSDNNFCPNCGTPSPQGKED